MIQLHEDFLLVETPPGQIIPCSAELVAVELIGDATGRIEPELIQQAAAAVLHYFRNDLNKKTVSVAEFARALEQALEALGAQSKLTEPANRGVQNVDLQQLAAGTEKALELGFFLQLRETLHYRIAGSPKVVHFHGLRHCVKALVGTKRWSRRCQTLNDQIVGFLRDCLVAEAPPNALHIVVH